ncbi:MAG: response regulator [Cohnella sp.]|nr:response regulator [Cohnella sp.]
MQQYSSLIVDDEQYAIEGILMGIRWDELNVTSVLTAQDAETAKTILASQPIDLLICDIEMPKMSGLNLLEWMTVNKINAETIFLTGHADFSYAKTALKLGSFDYLLKPVDYDELTATIDKALDAIAKRREDEQFNQVHKRYSRMFQAHKPLLEERFWQDFISRRLTPSRKTLEGWISSYELSFTADCRVLPILLSIEQWRNDIPAQDEEIMEYALRNVAGELILGERCGAVIRDHFGNNWVLFYGEPDELAANEERNRRCEHFIAMCNLHLSCDVSCYVGTAEGFPKLLGVCVGLLEEERANVIRTNSVLTPQSRRETPGQLVFIPWITEISVLFDLGNQTAVDKKLDEIFAILDKEEDLSVETLLSYYHALVHMLFNMFHKRGLSVQEALDSQQWDERMATRSLNHFKSWCRRVVQSSMEALFAEQAYSPDIIRKITAYIDDHLAEEFTRQQIAEFVHFNPAYLSRLFKREIGASLTDYILAKRIEKAKRLLATTRMKISDIAAAVGYDNIPYFSRKFKRVTNLTPFEYRKLHT